MNLFILIGVLAALVGLRFVKLNMLAWIVAWWLAIFALIRFGIQPPLPSSIVNLLMGIVSLALLTYVFSDSQRLASAGRPLTRFMVDTKFTVPLAIVVLLIPFLVAFKVYLSMSGEVTAPGFSRTIHPAPPASITFRGKNIDLVAGQNPFRKLDTENQESFGAHVENGRRVYYQNCVFCHGDNMEGDGLFAHALDPIPADLGTPGTISILQETYLFWRIAKGGPGLPEESTPWASAMPAWETFLTEDEIWDVILFLYQHSGQ